MRLLRRRAHRCDADTYTFEAPSGDFEIGVCTEGCGWWGAKLHGKPYAQGDNELGSREFEELQRRLRVDGRDDLADRVLRIQVLFEADDD
ncbi:MAG TPA: hypothetical protein VK506_05010 [Conexibacter sp.]|nr:hypothetical protein [Conexibacter sp.]